ncbi:hypothetical protein Pmar_PMAR029057 [Perkinsus marinus ATCC 50983]|uniref:Transcription elongation factor GreA/GreB N-terminal domain-containing protein n=1 Tax=Perkinsus marinus (strain ATCC 50983 / TXsc) TaxID=423536 RepID=C5L6D8_PERM5|nr:hypothetical protein Pmar_PMAR029057 [Perkinsus marinus ATCC 50983]EER07765.1 hypothetical protein Pmar_PMAR029057 [Perkinsus marinus ATCC 50983]|eukprot:XP_002775949.1 hypothetical protein Pmar_PMAR029057 [Perkinsus marinus ATCC 50983]
MDTGHVQPYAVSQGDHTEHAGYHAPLEALAKLDYRIKQLNAAIESKSVEYSPC